MDSKRLSLFPFKLPVDDVSIHVPLHCAHTSISNQYPEIGLYNVLCG